MENNLAENVKSELPSSLSESELKIFQDLTIEATGICLDNTKSHMIYARFIRRLRELNISTFDEYIDRIQDKNNKEYSYFVNAITTNFTYFFREPHHYKYLTDYALPELSRNDNEKIIRIWSAGSSSGQEAYSIAMSIYESRNNQSNNIKILATDIDTEMVTKTKEGIYNNEELRGVNTSQKERWFDKIENNKFRIKSDLRNLLLSRYLNLCERWPIRPSVDIVFCRNVLIYFNTELQIEIIRKFSTVQKSGSYLFLGHSETIREIDQYYKRVSNTVFKRL